ncbi:hypothetical protein [uncultured Draconibacterium sp.]|uniref:hypothetical protein n=1 Tax=uncultured Draconibacterium sp. TaxID=1573823 RepID=UPI0029C63BCC|nr:hypothetical protein [uncultured Draconibacterium sp.]
MNNSPLQNVRWVAWFMVTLPIGGVVALVLRKKSSEYGLLAIATAFMVTTCIIFWKPFQVLDDQSPVQKYKEIVSAHKEVVAYKDFHHAFAFYSPTRIPVFQDEQNLIDYLANHEDVVVLSRNHDLSYMDEIPELECIGIGRDLFSRKSTGVYLKH